MALARLKRLFQSTPNKHDAEFAYWRKRFNQEGSLRNEHFKFFYTEFFGLGETDYKGKKLLDIGCGPRGSLEWADGALERVGLDPLADRYAQLGTNRHRMRYVCARSEEMPFPAGRFDFVFSFNSLDHVDSLDKTIAEITRVIRPGGIFLLITEVGHTPTVCEPQSLPLETTALFTGFRAESERLFEKRESGIYQSLHANEIYLKNDGTPRTAILAAKLLRVGAACERAPSRSLPSRRPDPL